MTNPVSNHLNDTTSPGTRQKTKIFLPGLFVCLVPFCFGVGFGCAAFAVVFWASFSLTDRGTEGMGGSFSLHDRPSASVSAFVILRNNKKHWNKIQHPV